MTRHNDITDEDEEISTFYMPTDEHNEFIKKMWADEDDAVVDCFDVLCRRRSGTIYPTRKNVKVKRTNEVSKTS